jgi:hypothetical protein
MNNLNKKILLIGLGCLTAAAGYASAPGGPLTAQRRRTPLRKFTQEEDTRLRALVWQHGTGNWGLIAISMPGRDARSCRERWRIYLDPGINRSEWTEEEDALLLRKHDEFDSQWILIAAYFPNRTPENIRNRWEFLQRRNQRQQLARQQQRAQQPPPLAWPLPPQPQRQPPPLAWQPPQQRKQQQLPSLPPLSRNLGDFLELFK